MQHMEKKVQQSITFHNNITKPIVYNQMDWVQSKENESDGY